MKRNGKGIPLKKEKMPLHRNAGAITNYPYTPSMKMPRLVASGVKKPTDRRNEKVGMHKQEMPHLAPPLLSSASTTLGQL
jgi:hypothetical protein